MALEGEIVTNDGITHTVAYARIVEANLNWADEHAKITINIYHDKASRDSGKNPVEQKSYSFGQPIAEQTDGDGVVTVPAKPGFNDLFSVDNLVTQGENIIALLYGHFKTYDEWSTWQDVIEEEPAV